MTEIVSITHHGDTLFIVQRDTIYTLGNKIVVENATDEIRVYDAMGRLVGRDVSATSLQ